MPRRGPETLGVQAGRRLARQPYGHGATRVARPARRAPRAAGRAAATGFCTRCDRGSIRPSRTSVSAEYPDRYTVRALGMLRRQQGHHLRPAHLRHDHIREHEVDGAGVPARGGERFPADRSPAAPRSRGAAAGCPPPCARRGRLPPAAPFRCALHRGRGVSPAGHRPRAHFASGGDRFGGGGKVDGERGALEWRALDADVPAELLHDAVDRRQSRGRSPCRRTLVVKNGSKMRVARGRVHAAAGVAHRQTGVGHPRARRRCRSPS